MTTTRLPTSASRARGAPLYGTESGRECSKRPTRSQITITDSHGIVTFCTYQAAVLRLALQVLQLFHSGCCSTVPPLPHCDGPPDRRNRRGWQCWDRHQSLPVRRACLLAIERALRHSLTRPRGPRLQSASALNVLVGPAMWWWWARQRAGRASKN